MLIFPDVIRENIEAKYYQYLDMAWYRALPEGLPRRLYEYLDKKRYQNKNGVFSLSEVAICRWLPITDKHSTRRRKRLEAIAQALKDAGYLKEYMFDKKRKLCHFTYATHEMSKKEEEPNIIDQLLEKPQPEVHQTDKITQGQTTTCEDQRIFVDAMDWLNTIPYLQKKRKREVASLLIAIVAELYPDIRVEYDRRTKDGKRPRPSWVHQKFMVASGRVPAKKTKKTTTQEKQLELFVNTSNQPEPETETIEDVLNLLKIPKPTKKLLQAIEDHSQEKSYEYAKWSILYANKQVKNEPANTFSRRYSIYLQKTLRAGYAEEWKEEEQNRIEVAKERQAEEDRKREVAHEREKAQKKVEEEKPVFLAAVANLQEKEKKELWEKAKKVIPIEQEHGRSLTAKIEYLNELWVYLGDKGEQFSEAVRRDMDLAKKMVKPE